MIGHVVLALTVAAQAPAAKPATINAPKAGELVYLNVHPATTQAPRTFFLITAPDKESWGRLLEMNRRNAPRSEFETMAAEGRLLSAYANTRVRVVGHHNEMTVGAPGGQGTFHAAEVQLLDGPWKGRSGFLSHRYVTPAPNTDRKFLSALAEIKRSTPQHESRGAHASGSGSGAGAQMPTRNEGLQAANSSTTRAAVLEPKPGERAGLNYPQVERHHSAPAPAAYQSSAMPTPYTPPMHQDTSSAHQVTAPSYQPPARTAPGFEPSMHTPTTNHRP